VSVLHSHLFRVSKWYLIIILCVGNDMILCVNIFYNSKVSVCAFVI
jgi:hypothetical protein